MHQHLVRFWGFLSKSSEELGQDEQADNERWAGWSCHRDSGPWGTGGCGRADNLPEPSSHQSILSADWGFSGSPFISLAGNQPGHHYGRQQGPPAGSHWPHEGLHAKALEELKGHDFRTAGLPRAEALVLGPGLRTRRTSQEYHALRPSLTPPHSPSHHPPTPLLGASWCWKKVPSPGSVGRIKTASLTFHVSSQIS